MTPRLLIARPAPDAVLARARHSYDVVFNEADLVTDRADLLAMAKGADAVIAAPGRAFDGAFIGALPETVRMIATFSVGFDHLDLAAAKARGIVVTNTPDVLTDATADIALLCLLGAARRAWEGMKLLREGKWTGWTPTQLMGWHLGGKRLGIYGMGRIGQAVADRARAFGMAIHYSNRTRLSPELEKDAIFHPDPEDLLKVSDAFSINAPATPETDRFLDARRIGLLPENAIVVNTARGTLVDDDALIAALKSGRLAAAGLDVYRGEPKLDPRYLELSNAFLLPHQGSGTVETRNAMGFCCLDNLDAFFAGKVPPNRIA
jgi:lactate dehydrogenase-like 2-hydroxyacid dehydrogenase